MRNLKRALSLALASVMLVGMMVVGTSAASYPDVDDSKHNIEAIEVLNAVKVMQGDAGTGNFRPDDKVSRNEMAVIMARLVLGHYEADSYVGSHPFTDVPTWASRYVAACYNSGIINGTSATTYSGTSNVTAVQAAAMMLRALGYEDLSKPGQKWDIPVAGKANEVSLFKGLSGSSTAQLTRNDVAKLALNTLKADVVITERTGFDMEIPGVGTINSNVTYKPVARGAADGSEDDNYAEDGTGVGYQQLCEKLYPELKLEDSTDAFGRVATLWTYEDDDVVKTAKEAKKVYIGAVEVQDIYKDLNLKAPVATNKIDYYLDSDSGVDGTDAITNTGAGKTNEYGTDGQVVYVYYDKDAAKPVTICVISSYLGVVVDDDYTKDSKDGVLINVFGEGDLFYESTAYKEDDVLLVNISDGEIEAVVGTPKTVSGSVTRKGTDGALTVDGTKYARADKYTEAGDADVVDGIAVSAVKISSDNTYVLYLDENDNWLAVVEDTDNTTTDLVYVYYAEEGSALKNSKVEYGIYAKVVMMDGTVKEVLLKDSTQNIPFTGTEVNDWLTAKGITGPGMMTLNYDKDEDEYELTAASDSDYTSVDINGGASGVKLEADSKYAKLDNTYNYNLSEDTVYLFITENDDHDDIDDVERVVGGVDYEIASGAMGGSVFATDSKKNADYVVFLDEYTAFNKDVVYIKSADVKGNVDGGYLFEGYYATKGEKEEVPVYSVDGNTTTAASNKPTANKFYEYSEKSDGTLKLSDALTESDGAYENKTLASVSSRNMIDIGETDMYDATDAKIVDLTDVDVTNKAAADYNAYGREIKTLSTLKRVVEEDARYGDVTVDAYVNGDDEVELLIIKKVAAVPHVHSLTWSAKIDGVDPTCMKTGTPDHYTVVSCANAGCDLDLTKWYAAAGSAIATGTAMTDAEKVLAIDATAHHWVADGSDPKKHECDNTDAEGTACTETANHTFEAGTGTKSDKHVCSACADEHAATFETCSAAGGTDHTGSNAVKLNCTSKATTGCTIQDECNVQH